MRSWSFSACNSSWSIDGVRHQGLTILDTTEVQDRKPNPKIRRISSFNWGPPENFGGSHSSEFVNIKGRQYVICEDETMGANSAAPWGWARRGCSGVDRGLPSSDASEPAMSLGRCRQPPPRFRA